VWKSKFYGAFRRVDLHPTHWLISTQVRAFAVDALRQVSDMELVTYLL